MTNIFLFKDDVKSGEAGYSGQGKGQETEGRRQKAEGRRQKAEGRGQDIDS
jgi:hypothetical protein